MIGDLGSPPHILSLCNGLSVIKGITINTMHKYRFRSSKKAHVMTVGISGEHKLVSQEKAMLCHELVGT